MLSASSSSVSTVSDGIRKLIVFSVLIIRPPSYDPYNTALIIHNNMLYYAALQRPTAVALAFFELLTFNFELQLLVLENKKRGSQLRPLLLKEPPQSAIYGRSA